MMASLLVSRWGKSGKACDKLAHVLTILFLQRASTARIF
jgi:hypothetical protein